MQQPVNQRLDLFYLHKKPVFSRLADV